MRDFRYSVSVPHTTYTATLTVLAACFYAGTLSAQQHAPAAPPQFDAVSVHTAAPDAPARWRYTPDGVAIDNIDLPHLIMEAYHLNLDYQVLGLPGWVHSAHYAIQAKVAEADIPAMKNLDWAQRGQMLQPILASRFALRSHWETRLLPVEKLEVSGKNANLKDVTNADNSNRVTVGEASTGPGGILTAPDGRVVAHAIQMGTLVSMLQSELHQQVIDDTGLTGKYDFEMKLNWDQPNPGAAQGASYQDSPVETVADALSQIGLKLVSTKAELPVLVIDNLQPPTPN